MNNTYEKPQLFVVEIDSAESFAAYEGKTCYLKGYWTDDSATQTCKDTLANYSEHSGNSDCCEKNSDTTC